MCKMQIAGICDFDLDLWPWNLKYFVKILCCVLLLQFQTDSLVTWLICWLRVEMCKKQISHLRHLDLDLWHWNSQNLVWRTSASVLIWFSRNLALMLIKGCWCSRGKFQISVTLALTSDLKIEKKNPGLVCQEILFGELLLQFHPDSLDTWLKYSLRVIDVQDTNCRSPWPWLLALTLPKFCVVYSYFGFNPVHFILGINVN